MQDTVGKQKRRLGKYATIVTITLVVGAISGLMALTAGAQTGEVATVEIRFWGYSRNPEFFAYQTTNHLGEELFCVGQVGEVDPIFTQQADEETSARDILVSREMRDTYGWNSDGVTGSTSPSGYWELDVRESGAMVNISVRHGRDVNPIGTMSHINDGSNFATVELKEARWSDDGAYIVVILHQVLEGEWPMQVDMAQGFSVPPSPTAPPQ